MKRTIRLFLPSIVLVAMCLLPVLAYFHPGLPITHDGKDHVARIANFYQALSEGAIVPRWAGNLNWGYGHPILMFLYPLPSYIGSFFHAFGFSLVDSVKIVFAGAYGTSILVMYFWLKEKWGITPALVGAVLYGYAPYRFVDMHVRGAIGEHVAFVFLPLILWGVDRLVRRREWGEMLIIFGSAGLMLSHNAVSIMFFPLVCIYLLYVVAVDSKQPKMDVLRALFCLGIGFGVSAFFWIPAFFEGKYTLRDIVTKGDVTNRFVPFSAFFWSTWNFGGGTEFTKSIGITHWLLMLGSVLLFLKSKEKSLRILLIGSLIVFVGALFLMTWPSGFIWQHVSILQKFQFPWRLLTITTFISSFIGATVCWQYKHIKGLSFFVVLCTVILSAGYWRANGYTHLSDAYYSDTYYGTTDTGESSPIWSVRFMEHVADAPMAIIEGSGSFEVGTRSFSHHAYVIDVAEKSRIVENTLYFPGWNVFVDGISVPIEFQDPAQRGLITYWISEGHHTVDIVFRETKVRIIGSLVSLIALCVAVFMVLYNPKKRV